MRIPPMPSLEHKYMNYNDFDPYMFHIVSTSNAESTQVSLATIQILAGKLSN